MAESTFFRGRRLSVYCKGGRLHIDKKTEKRSWSLKLALTLTDDDAQAAGGLILSNYRQIQTRSNAVEKIEMGGGFSLIVQFLADSTLGAGKLLRLDKCFVDELALTYENEQTEMWLQLEHENTDKLHAFVKDYAFTRFAVEFIPLQRTIAEAIAESSEAKEHLQTVADETGVETALFDGKGIKLIECKPKGRAN